MLNNKTGKLASLRQCPFCCCFANVDCSFRYGCRKNFFKFICCILPLPLSPSHKGRGILYSVRGRSNIFYSPLVGESKSLISERGLYKTEGIAQNAEEEELFLCEPSKPKDLTPPLPQGVGECTDMSQSLSHSVTQSLLSQNFFPQGDIIFSNILEDKHDKLENFTLTSLSKRAEILDYTIEKIQNLFKQNALPKDIAIITPLQDDMLRFTLNENLKCNVLFLSGSEKLVDNPLVKASLNILKLMLGIEISEMDLRVIISDYAGIPLKYAYNILHAYDKEKKLPEIDLEFYNDNYQRFYKAFCEIKDNEKDEKLEKIKIENTITGAKCIEAKQDHILVKM